MDGVGGDRPGVHSLKPGGIPPVSDGEHHGWGRQPIRTGTLSLLGVYQYQCLELAAPDQEQSVEHVQIQQDSVTTASNIIRHHHLRSDAEYQINVIK